MTQKTTTKNILKMIALAMMIQGITLTTQAAGTCLVDKSDIHEDMQKIKVKLNLKYSHLYKIQTEPLKSSKIEEIYDQSELRVDRADPFLNSFLQQVNSVGVVSDVPVNSNEIQYGSAVLISRCHVLINAHAITNQKVRTGDSPIFISLGQNSCDSKNEFLHQDIKGKVILSGNPEQPSLDYAIVKIHKISDIEPALISTVRILIKLTSHSYQY